MSRPFESRLKPGVPLPINLGDVVTMIPREDLYDWFCSAAIIAPEAMDSSDGAILVELSSVCDELLGLREGDVVWIPARFRSYQIRVAGQYHWIIAHEKVLARMEDMNSTEPIPWGNKVVTRPCDERMQRAMSDPRSVEDAKRMTKDGKPLIAAPDREGGIQGTAGFQTFVYEEVVSWGPECKKPLEKGMLVCISHDIGSYRVRIRGNWFTIIGDEAGVHCGIPG